MADYDQYISRTEAASLQAEDRFDQIFQGITEASAVLKLATKLRDMTKHERKLPVLENLVEAFVLGSTTAASGETALMKTSDASWKDVSILAADMGTVVPVPINTLEDSDYDIWMALEPKVIEALGKLIDSLILHKAAGSAPTDWPIGIVPYCVANSKTVDLSTQLAAGDDLYDVLLGESGVVSIPESDGYYPTGHIAALSMRSKLRGCRDANGQPIFVSDPNGPVRYSLDGEPIMFPRNGGITPSSALLISGAWDQLVYSWRKNITFDVSAEGVISDSDGKVQINLKQQRYLALYCHIRFGWALPTPPNQINATPYPFGVLVP